ncbi:PTS sugar transporter subunit IIA [Zoogloea sp.]|uniref:PTS sugar transporter subunit IIA n=1 Tax=Zoogloea sp. TaxID=49181 RepID=UPI001A41FCE5|nr:PTS fructose transporter subunit IIA [uncultured Zoogloea sp.]MBL8435016.1 PTS fructose transporter subunit IIA [Zoogloea sp.]MCK6386006.1 PTS fructose transporter subunit IIA [Zoogloea sp.]
MIGILLITHGTLGEALVQCVSHVMNRRPAQLMQLGISGQDDPLDALPLARRLIELVDSGKGVLILTDILGATPANTAAKLLEPGRIEGVTGVNVPMLLRVITYRERAMEVLVKKAVAGACEGVVHMK